MNALIKTFVSNNIVGTLRIVDGQGWLGYAYLTSQADVDQVEDCNTVGFIALEAATFCKENNASLYSY